MDPSHGLNFTYPINLALLLVENGRAGSLFGLPPDLVTPPLPLPPGFTGTEDLEWTDTFTRQTTSSYGLFGQMNWHVVDRLTLLAGSRLSLLTKHVTMTNQNHSTKPGDASPTIDSSVAEYVNATLDRDEFHFSPKVGGKYDWSDDLNFYATWSRGFRAGGIGVFSQTGNLEDEQYEDETVTNWDVGSKWNFLDGAASLNLGLFWMTLSDFQVFTILPGAAVVTPAIVNAPEAQARGVETDVTWLPTDWLTLRGTLGFNDTEFTDFPIGTCEVDRPNTDGDDDPRCDLTGRPLVRAPQWSVST
ncbi:MAG: TonB-dependent receptor, partial [Candidatus Binatia bacterium]